MAETMQYMEKVDGSSAAGAKNVPVENASSTANVVAAVGLQLCHVALHNGIELALRSGRAAVVLINYADGTPQFVIRG